MSEPSTPEPESSVDAQIPKVRYIFVIPIVATFVASLVLLVLGFVETFKVIYEAVSYSDPHILQSLKIHFVEIIDVFLLATILYVIASGFWQLFLGRPNKLAPWMQVNSVHDLEVMLIGVTITLLGVTGLAFVLSWDGESALWQVGLAIGSIIAALAYFIGRGRH
jgi:uncharacterized membrane protein YqhA